MVKGGCHIPAITFPLQATERSKIRTLNWLCRPLGQLSALIFLEVSLHILTYLSLDLLRHLHLAPKGPGKCAHPRWLPVLLELAAVRRRGEQVLGGNRQPEATGNLSFHNKQFLLSREAR